MTARRPCEFVTNQSLNAFYFERKGARKFYAVSEKQKGKRYYMFK